ncbi:MAG: hypothetical protein U0935_11800 [Pirellulales bacterium]
MSASDGNGRTVHELRRRWKPHKERLVALRADHPTPIRLHRAFSWLARVERLGAEDLDLALVSHWVALNALYGQWNSLAGMSVGDRESWRVFLERVLELDTPGHLRQLLTEHQRLVKAILEDAYLSDLFWQDPAPTPVQTTRRMRSQAQVWYLEKRWRLILESALDRVYLMRCQLIHGAATYGGKLNRRSLRHCCQLLGHLLPTILTVMIDHGSDEDWGIICYPPVGSEK